MINHFCRINSVHERWILKLLLVVKCMCICVFASSPFHNYFMFLTSTFCIYIYMCMCVCFLNHQIQIDIPRMSPESLVLQPKVTEVRTDGPPRVTSHASIFQPLKRMSLNHHPSIYLSVCLSVCQTLQLSLEPKMFCWKACVMVHRVEFSEFLLRRPGLFLAELSR